MSQDGIIVCHSSSTLYMMSQYITFLQMLYLASIPDPNNPSEDHLQYLVRGEGGFGDLTGGNADLWNVDNSFTHDVIEISNCHLLHWF